MAEEVEALRAAVARQRREPPLGWPGLVAWEARHGVVLPEPYRTFVAEIADGCSLRLSSAEGPLLPLGRLPESWHRWDSVNWLSPEPFDSRAPRDPAAPFPLAEEWQWEYEFDPEEHVALMASLHRDGSLILGAEEPGSYWALITAGPQRGNIWLLADGIAFPCTGLDRDCGHVLGFLEWVGQWQDPVSDL